MAVTPRKNRRWLRRILRGAFWTLLVLVVFHRPIVHYGGRWVAIWIAKRENIALDLRIEGNVWSRLELHDIRATSTGPTPIERLTLDRFVVDYGLWQLIRGDLAGLRAVEIGTLDAIITPDAVVKKPAAPASGPRTSPAEQVRKLLSNPFPTPSVKLTRADVRVKQREGDVVVRGFHFASAPGANGRIGWERIEIPGVPTLEAAGGVIALDGGKFAVTTLALLPEIAIESFALTRENGVEVVAKIAGGRVAVTVQPAAGGQDFTASIAADGVAVTQLAGQFGAKVPAAISLTNASIRITADPSRPEAVQTTLTLAGIATPDAQPTPAPFALTANLRDGSLEITTLTARFSDAEFKAAGKLDVSQFLAKERPPTPQPAGQLTFTLTAPDLAPFGAELRQPLRGALDSKGTVTIANGIAKLDATLNGSALTAPGVTLAKAAVTLRAELPLDSKTPLRALIADVSATLEEITFPQSAPSAALAQRKGDTPVAQSRDSGSPNVAVNPGTPAGVQSDKSVALPPTPAPPAQAAVVPRVDCIRATASLRDLRATLGELIIERGANSLRASGAATLDAKGQLAAAPNVTFKLNAPALAEFGVAVNGAMLNGALSGEGRITLDVTQPRVSVTGSTKLEAKSLRLGEAPIGDIALETDFAEGAAIVKNLTATLGAQVARESPRGNNAPLREDSRATLAATARVAFAPPHAYSGGVKLNAPDLAAFAPLATIFGVKDEIGGSVALDWKGAGDLAKHDGSAQFTATAARFGKTLIAEAKLATNYSPDKFETTELLVVADKLRATGKLTWAGKRLDISALELQLADEAILTGSLSAPLDPQAKQPLAHDQPLSAKLDATKLDLAKVFTSLGQRAPVTGILSMKLDATGTLAQPSLTLDLDGRDLAVAPAPPPPKKTIGPRKNLNDSVRSEATAARSKDVSTFGGITTTARLTFAKDVGKLTGNIRHPELKPLTFSVEVPLALAPLFDGARPDFAKIPLKASVELPASSLAFATKLAPALKKFDGTAAISVRASGTLAAPRFDGSASLDVKLLRLDGSLPPVTDLAARLVFAGDTLTFERFNGETGGGKFSLSGKVNLAKPADPIFDLGLKADDVLAMRDDSIVVRADADVTLRGPLNEATAAGVVFVTQSRFNKEVEILPLALPGRPKPTPRAVSQPMVISFPEKPLRDWKFDIAIQTRADDPFRVRGNLTRGEASLDLRLAGTGLAPYLTGAVTIEKLRALLPVSTLNTRRGLVTFSQDAPFEPRLDIEAESVIRRYTVLARVDGMASAPRLDLTSEPPLPQGEILSLLTTGSLTGEVGANNAAMATRAAVLVVKGWYKKLFKRDLPASSDEGGDALLDRFEVELGSVDARTGQNEVAAQFRATDKLFFLGDLGLRGDFTGRVKYLIRFR